MQFATLAAVMATLLSSHMVSADWASESNVISSGGCGTAATILIPIFENDAWDSVCNDLVADGCADAFVIGEADLGSTIFARNTDLSCEAVAPLGQETCTNAFRNAYGQCSSTFSPGELPSCSVGVFDADGQSLGVLGFTGSCLPVVVPERKMRRGERA